MKGPRQIEFDALHDQYVNERLPPPQPLTAAGWAAFDRTPEGQAYQVAYDKVSDEFFAKAVALLHYSGMSLSKPVGANQ